MFIKPFVSRLAKLNGLNHVCYFGKDSVHTGISLLIPTLSNVSLVHAPKAQNVVSRTFLTELVKSL